VAVNAWVSPFGTLGLAGVTAIDEIVTFLTVRTVEPTTVPIVALIDDVPCATAVASPDAVMVAIDVVAEPQVTWLFTSSVVLSVRIPRALNCKVVPGAMLGLAGVTTIDWSTGGVTVKTVDPLRPLNVALIDDVPVVSVVARPADEIVATASVADAHVT
jgi:hypothetical protein